MTETASSTVDDMGAVAKTVEGAWSLQVPHETGLIVRIDGKRFSKWTKRYEAPFDPRITEAFRQTMAGLMESHHADVGYTQSDEITLAWYPQSGASEHPFGGKVSKLTSILASDCTARFNQHFDLGPPALFDARAFGASVEEIGLVLRWRYADAKRNGVSAVARSVFSHKSLLNVRTADRRIMLADKGVNLADYPAANMEGTAVRFETVMEELEPGRLAEIPVQYRPDGPVERRKLIEVDPATMHDSRYD